MTSVDITIGRVELGRTGLRVSPVCLGTAAWGVASPVHGLTVPEEDAVSTVHAAFSSSVNFLDTSNNYGDGESERRIGVALAQAEAPDDFVIQTKLDRDPITDSFDRDRMRRSLDESLTRLGLSRVPLLYLHDPEHITFEQAMEAGGPVETLMALRDEGYADHVGISGGPATLLQRFVETGIFDALITHNRFTLVDRTADELLTVAAEAGIGVINGAVYGGGILSAWPRVTDNYHYRRAQDELLTAVDAMGRACERHGVPLIAAALQASTRDPRIHSTICGMVSPAQLQDTITQLAVPIPDELWDELDSLRPAERTWIND
ncbi:MULTISPECIES: aldo/keto reductase [unclassified Microbacterium]|uniref:aldo/keto reductase n=1 Tax=unclassified Microbacterium TaxID=2609290 RepID=UPI000EAA1914|nr:MULTISPECIES: aldo/keto reductase [unclassified Microbacterium]MBT2484408.1 aldo/keto reductase [Microbacterium sp. ISL-108]RKN67318.1 aldo/keto reductase [Microbacterium sp. CGR2]